ncbi:hypothetical protein J1N35_012469 [Gossypium stocksii]|uniref:Uncharacterized protein n=1 Tax=Gossypium stocksii TaxID=47602 RepID=A0A9D3W4C6_9ROSI|nr:hypothetical protein J1N35_012469 [Gossypium stocksii]
MQSTNSKITSRSDGTTEIKFDHSNLKYPKTPSVFPTMLMMQPVPDPKEGHIPGDLDCCCGLCKPGLERKLIESFSADTSYEQEFPPLQEFTQQWYTHTPKIPSKLPTDESGKPTKTLLQKKKKSKEEKSEEDFQRIAQTQPKVEVPSDDDLMVDETQQGESSFQAPRTTKGSSIGRMTFTLDDILPEK